MMSYKAAQAQNATVAVSLYWLFCRAQVRGFVIVLCRNENTQQSHVIFVWYGRFYETNRRHFRHHMLHP